jgi:hypothetical protein
VALIEYRQRITPDIGEVHRAGDRAVGALGQAYIIQGRAAVGLEDARVARMGQYLVDTAARHDVSGEKQGDCIH